MALRLFNAVIMGSPGSGKGTIASYIVDYFGLKHLCIGDVLRNEILAGSDIGKKADFFIGRGQLVPDDLVTRLISSIFSKCYGTRGISNLLIDGFPRTVPQARSLEELITLSCVIHLDVPDEVILDRVKGRLIHAPSGRVYNVDFNPPKVAGLDDVTGEPLTYRHDDDPDIVKERLHSYKNETMPLLCYYRKKQILYNFQGRESKEIWPRVRTMIEQLLQKQSVEVS